MAEQTTDAAAEELAAARAAYQRRDWADAHRQLAAVDRTAPLAVEDLERLATAAYLIGREDEYFAALERAYQIHDGTDPGRAVRCAFWLVLGLMFAGKPSRANGWLARARAVVDKVSGLEAEAGYLLIPEIERQLGSEDWAAAEAAASRVVDIGERCAEPDLAAAARHLQGRALLGAFQIEAGLSLLDQVMLDVSSGALSPIMAGLLYCSVIDACQQVYELARAREWTDELTSWCEAQPQMIAFSGACLVHRAEIMQLGGQWGDAIHEARRACDRYTKSQLDKAGAAIYRQGEIHRLRGDYEAAEQSYREASAAGFEPQPGLALLRLGQGNHDVACGSIRRLVAACGEPLRKAGLLVACAEIMLAAGKLEEAREACSELAEVAALCDTEVLAAMAASAEAAVAMAEGEAQRALDRGRVAFEIWQRVGAPYEAARSRIVVGSACRALGDDDGAALELSSARAQLEQLGAGPELDRLAALTGKGASRPPATHGLTPRELEVLRHVAAGKTNRAIAGELHVSEKTVDRHVSNIFNKLDVSTRTAAAAFAFEHGLT